MANTIRILNEAFIWNVKTRKMSLIWWNLIFNFVFIIFGIYYSRNLRNHFYIINIFIIEVAVPISAASCQSLYLIYISGWDSQQCMSDLYCTSQGKYHHTVCYRKSLHEFTVMDGYCFSTDWTLSSENEPFIAWKWKENRISFRSITYALLSCI